MGGGVGGSGRLGGGGQGGCERRIEVFVKIQKKKLGGRGGVGYGGLGRGDGGLGRRGGVGSGGRGRVGGSGWMCKKN